MTATRDRVLLVSDIPDQARAYFDALSRLGFRVHLAASGEDALRLIARGQPDCAVIDLRLPDMSGWELCRTLRARNECRTMAIVVLTPEVSRSSARHSVDVGCNAWLMHPAVAEDVVRTVRQVLRLEAPGPASSDDALLAVAVCPACGSDNVRPTLRVSPIQYYCCRGCGFCWRVEALAPVP